MGTSPSALRPDEVRVKQLLDDSGTGRVGQVKLQEYHASKYACIKSPIAEMLEVEAGQDLDVFVNVEHDLVMFQISEDDGPD